MRRAFLLLLVPALLGLVATVARGSVDPFYDRLYRDGLNASAAGDQAVAARKLRLASFGMLDDPPLLATCIGHLALIEAERGEKQAVRESIDRLLELERLFQALTKASSGNGNLSASDREAIDDLIRQNVSPQAVADIPAFRQLALRMMAPAERRRELDRRIAVEPRNPDWRQLLAELFYEERQFSETIREAQHVLDLKPGSEAGHCLRGLARAALEDCSDVTLDDLAFCRQPAQLGATLAQVSCYLERGNAAGARAAFNHLPAGERSTDAVKSLEKELVKLEKKAGN
jgi:hypothetical protein